MLALAISATLVGNTQQPCVEEVVKTALAEQPRLSAAPKLTDKHVRPRDCRRLHPGRAWPLDLAAPV